MNAELVSQVLGVSLSTAYELMEELALIETITAEK